MTRWTPSTILLRRLSRLFGDTTVENCPIMKFKDEAALTITYTRVVTAGGGLAVAFKT